MELLKFTRFTEEFIKNLPSDMLSELIVLEDVIPDDIMATMYMLNLFYKKERNEFLEYRPDLIQKMHAARYKRKELAKEEDIVNVRTDENVQFIKDYPQYKQLIDHIEFRDKDLNIIKVVPIDEYLAEN